MSDVQYVDFEEIDTDDIITEEVPCDPLTRMEQYYRQLLSDVYTMARAAGKSDLCTNKALADIWDSINTLKGRKEYW